MKCPYCGHLDSRVIESRTTEEMTAVRRRRECPDCKRRFTTYERIEGQPLVVIKKDGSREAFSREKILNGMLKACEKRPIPLDVLEQASFDIEKEVRDTGKGEISSRQIGELVMDRLKEIDDVAYVRFASVYREFRDVDSFLKEVERILDERSRQRG
ncbi:MAG: transcriptional regulator NrdR [Bacillota bacterium]|nr:transcriptional repressor NrdR [Candidatus Fermentithermobacillaceae bacterium]HAF67068.1 transcriptional regulator NrdR [Clostridiales bacterium UBA9857]HOA70816.1 transcriptional regulator NrdR [Bacillota bacterium]HOP70477.1 transcriptional regulator NrdR [Bacillota bacterium]HPT35888.1 transcriptional regulator NrdR [Bacillota bacterium]